MPGWLWVIGHLGIDSSLELRNSSLEPMAVKLTDEGQDNFKTGRRMWLTGSFCVN
jgi:hypothetical protein